jgi:DEAD/DEAH box helicase domain-containing protein
MSPHDGPVDAASHDVETRCVGDGLDHSAIYICDCDPGGVGLGEGLYDHHREFVEMARDLLDDCDCKRGCPSRFGPTEPEETERSAVRTVLERLVEAA